MGRLATASILVALVLAAPSIPLAQEQKSDEDVPESYAASGADLPKAWNRLHRAFFELAHDAPNRAAQTLLDIRRNHARSPASHLACPMLDAVARHHSVAGRADRGCRPSETPPARHERFVVNNPDWVRYRDAFEALAAGDGDRSSRILAGLRDRRKRHPTTPLAEELLEALERVDAEPPAKEEKSLATRRKEFAGPVGEPPPLPPREDEKEEADEQEEARAEKEEDQEDEQEKDESKEKAEDSQEEKPEEKEPSEQEDSEQSEQRDARAEAKSDSGEDEMLEEPIDDPDAEGYNPSRPPISKRLALMSLGAFLGALIGMSTNALIGAALGEVAAGPYSTGPGAGVGAFAGLVLTPPIGAFIAGENMGGKGKLWASYLGFFLGAGAGILLGAGTVSLGPGAAVIGVIVGFTLPWLGSAVGYELTDSRQDDEQKE